MPGAEYDAVVVGAGPNGLAAAVHLARSGRSVLVVEGADRIGGGTRTTELTLPGYRHDVCSAVHPIGFLSPFLRSLPLQEHGLEWVHPSASVAHPLPGRPAAILERSIDRTGERLGGDSAAWDRLVAPFMDGAGALFEDLLTVPSLPSRPLLSARFGMSGVRSARGLAEARFQEDPARALFAGLAAHSILPLERAGTAGVGLVFAIAGHVVDWPVARGGSAAITEALESLLRSDGGEVRTGWLVSDLRELPAARAYLLDLAPAQVARIAADRLPARYLRALGRYRYGPGVFKLDWALDGPIPWSDPDCGRASTVHLGGTLDEIAAAEAAVWRGEHPDRPYVLVCQQSLIDPSRAPAGRQTGWAYCHVPAGSRVDMTDAIEAQIERSAPGFRDRILARHALSPADLQAYNPSYIGGAITGGVADLAQLVARPVLRLDPHTTPNPSIFLCSASTPPGGGVHGMCGLLAARAALKHLARR